METQTAKIPGNFYAIPGIINLGKALKKKKRITVPTTEEILSIVSNYFKRDPEEVMEKTRKREIVQTRQIAMYFAKILTKDSLATIGHKIGGKDHATVLHACKTVNNLCDTDKRFLQNVEEIRYIFLNKYNKHPASRNALYIPTSNMKVYIHRKEKVVRIAQLYPCSFREFQNIYNRLEDYGVTNTFKIIIL